MCLIGIALRYRLKLHLLSLLTLGVVLEERQSILGDQWTIDQMAERSLSASFDVISEVGHRTNFCNMVNLRAHFNSRIYIPTVGKLSQGDPHMAKPSFVTSGGERLQGIQKRVAYTGPY